MATSFARASSTAGCDRTGKAKPARLRNSRCSITGRFSPHGLWLTLGAQHMFACTQQQQPRTGARVER